jgi:hypothetical protein
MKTSTFLKVEVLFVTPEVEKSNFYRDLEGVLDWKDPVIDIENNYDYRIPSKRKKKLK